MTTHVLHAVRAFSAQPTLGAALSAAIPGGVVVHEVPFPEALRSHLHPDVVWVSSADAASVDAARTRFPTTPLLATLPRRASPSDVVVLLAHGADLVLRDEGVVLAAAGIISLTRRHGRLEAPSGALTGDRPTGGTVPGTTVPQPTSPVDDPQPGVKPGPSELPDCGTRVFS